MCEKCLHTSLPEAPSSHSSYCRVRRQQRSVLPKPDSSIPCHRHFRQHGRNTSESLRKDAADIFVDTLNPEYYVGIVFFCDENRIDSDAESGDTLNKQVIKYTLGPITYADAKGLLIGGSKKPKEMGSLGETHIPQSHPLFDGWVRNRFFKKKWIHVGLYGFRLAAATARLGLKRRCLYYSTL